MAYGIAMKQTVTRIRKSGDDWDGTGVDNRVDLKCALLEGTKLVRSMTGTSGAEGVSSSEVVSSARIFFDKLADVALTDRFEYANELGITRTYTPITIEVKRLAGKPILTVVSV